MLDNGGTLFPTLHENPTVLSSVELRQSFSLACLVLFFCFFNPTNKIVPYFHLWGGIYQLSLWLVIMLDTSRPGLIDFTFFLSESDIDEVSDLCYIVMNKNRYVVDWTRNVSTVLEVWRAWNASLWSNLLYQQTNVCSLFYRYIMSVGWDRRINLFSVSWC